MKHLSIALIAVGLIFGIGVANEANISKKPPKNIKAKSVGHVGGFAVSGRVSTLKDKNTTSKKIKEAKAKKEKNNTKAKTKSVGHVGGFAVSGRVSTIKDKNTTTKPKDIKPKK